MHASNDKSTIKSSNKKIYATPELVLLVSSQQVAGKGVGNHESRGCDSAGGCISVAPPSKFPASHFPHPSNSHPHSAS
jgi:hypothetical protein